MKQLFRKSLTALLIVLAAQMGCTKSGSNDAQVPLPDLSDFTITSATPFAAGKSSTINVYCTTLGSGTYTAHFDLTGSNTLSAQSATFVLSNGTGSFKTANLPNAGETFLTLNSITNIKGGGTAFVNNNKYTISDSTGLMITTIGGTNTFNAYDVLATMTGHTLSIRGVMPEPFMTTITLVVDSFTQTNGVIDFSSYNVPEIAHAQYTVPGGGTLSANGTIKFITIQPNISGTFSFTGMDSTKFTSGSFSVPAPK